MKKKLFRTINTIKARKANKNKRKINHFLRQHMISKKINAEIIKSTFLNSLFNEDTPKKSSFSEDKDFINIENNTNHITCLSLFMKSKRYGPTNCLILFD